MNCKYCNAVMERVFRFDTEGKATRVLVCPNCGAETKPKELTYTEEGNVVISTDKKGNPTLAYQIANPEAKDYCKPIKVRQKSDEKDEKRNKSGKPHWKNKKKKKVNTE